MKGYIKFKKQTLKDRAIKKAYEEFGLEFKNLHRRKVKKSPAKAMSLYNR